MLSVTLINIQLKFQSFFFSNPVWLFIFILTIHSKINSSVHRYKYIKGQHDINMYVSIYHDYKLIALRVLHHETNELALNINSSLSSLN